VGRGGGSVFEKAPNRGMWRGGAGAKTRGKKTSPWPPGVDGPQGWAPLAVSAEGWGRAETGGPRGAGGSPRGSQTTARSGGERVFCPPAFSFR